MTSEERAALERIRELIDGYVDIDNREQPNDAMKAEYILDALLNGEMWKAKLL